MKKFYILSTALFALASATPSYAGDPAEHKHAGHSHAEHGNPDICEGFGPQTPRDITSKKGTNPVKFPLAPSYKKMNLCNIHTHTNAEHKGPGFNVFVNDGENGGYACNETDSLTEAELKAPEGENAYKGVKPGDTIEVHWVHSSCDVQPGPTLGACLSEACGNPALRVETQVFLVVNDEDALDFNNFGYDTETADAQYRQAKALPKKTGKPVVFGGSTTGPSFDEKTCSPLQVTWSVRPRCAKVDINSLNTWAANGNVFDETKSHGVRQLVESPELLSEIK